MNEIALRMESKYVEESLVRAIIKNHRKITFRYETIGDIVQVNAQAILLDGPTLVGYFSTNLLEKKVLGIVVEPEIGFALMESFQNELGDGWLVQYHGLKDVEEPPEDTSVELL